MPELTPLSTDEIEARAREWMDAARQALAARRGVVAAQRLNQVLGLPANSQTETAQALMGEAREHSGELSNARVEYEFYLKLYPNGSHTAQVKEKLSSLDTSLARISPDGLAISTSPHHVNTASGTGDRDDAGRTVGRVAVVDRQRAAGGVGEFEESIEGLSRAS